MPRFGGSGGRSGSFGGSGFGAIVLIGMIIVGIIVFLL